MIAWFRWAPRSCGGHAASSSDLHRGIAQSKGWQDADVEDLPVTPSEFVDLPFGYVVAALQHFPGHMMRAGTRKRRLERRTFGLADEYRHQLALPVRNHRVSRLARSVGPISLAPVRLPPDRTPFCVAHQIGRKMYALQFPPLQSSGALSSVRLEVCRLFPLPEFKNKASLFARSTTRLTKYERRPETGSGRPR